MRADARRLFIALRGWDLDRRTIATLADIAALMRADLDAVLLRQDELPLSREFLPAINEWKPIDAERIQAEITAVAKRAQRLVEEAVRATGIVGRFEIAKGNLAALVAERVGHRDIVAITEPGVPHADFITLQPDTLYRGAAATLLLPRQAARRRGAIAALVRGPSDPALLLAAEIALVSGNRLILLVAADGEVHRQIIERIISGGFPRDRVRIIELPRLDTQAVLAALEYVGESVIVLSRHSGHPESDVTPAHLKSVRRIPLLLVEPDPTRS